MRSEVIQKRLKVLGDVTGRGTPVSLAAVGAIEDIKDALLSALKVGLDTTEQPHLSDLPSIVDLAHVGLLPHVIAGVTTFALWGEWLCVEGQGIYHRPGMTQEDLDRMAARVDDVPWESGDVYVRLFLDLAGGWRHESQNCVD